MKSQISLPLFDLAWPKAAAEKARGGRDRDQKQRLQICLLRSVYTQLLRPLVFQSCGSNSCKPPSDKRSMRLTGLTYSTEQPHYSCTDNRGEKGGGGGLTRGEHFGHLSTRRMPSHRIMYHICGALSLSNFPIIKTFFFFFIKPANCISKKSTYEIQLRNQWVLITRRSLMTSCHIDADDMTVSAPLGQDCILQPLPWCLALVLILAFKHTNTLWIPPLQLLWAAAVSLGYKERTGWDGDRDSWASFCPSPP